MDLKGVRKIIHRNREIIVIDYSGYSGGVLIEILNEAQSLILSEKKKCAVLSIANNKTFASSPFIRHLENIFPNVAPLIEKQAIIGITPVQAWIVKGINLWANPKLCVFDSMDIALDYLTDNNKMKAALI
ncbi:MAG: hypothetical protein KF775_11535 [Cyclobacteriaceae bacterium]|nr:hypothetical protein [Cyclobacteriaceae bacterium]